MYRNWKLIWVNVCPLVISQGAFEDDLLDSLFDDKSEWEQCCSFKPNCMIIIMISHMKQPKLSVFSYFDIHQNIQ